MRKIIEEGNLCKPKTCRCAKCGTKFEYEREDIYGITRDVTDETKLTGYVRCPYCENATEVTVSHGILPWVCLVAPGIGGILGYLIYYFVC